MRASIIARALTICSRSSSSLAPTLPYLKTVSFILIHQIILPLGNKAGQTQPTHTKICPRNLSLCLSLSINQVAQAFGLQQVDSTREKSPLRELAPLGGSEAGQARERSKDTPENRGRGVEMELQRGFCCERIGS